MLTCGRCSVVALCYEVEGHFRQVVIIWSWSCDQVWLYFRIRIEKKFVLIGQRDDNSDSGSLNFRFLFFQHYFVDIWHFSFSKENSVFFFHSDNLAKSWIVALKNIKTDNFGSRISLTLSFSYSLSLSLSPSLSLSLLSLSPLSLSLALSPSRASTVRFTLKIKCYYKTRVLLSLEACT